MHPISEAQHKGQGGLLLDVVVIHGAVFSSLLDQPQLVVNNAFLVLNICLDILNGVTGLHHQGDCHASQSLHGDMHPT